VALTALKALLATRAGVERKLRGLLSATDSLQGSAAFVAEMILGNDGRFRDAACEAVRTENSDLHFGQFIATTAGAETGLLMLIRSDAPPLVFTSA
jgi:hypothetical protein